MSFDNVAMAKKTGRTILVIDDEPEILDALKELLEAYDYDVVTAASGLEGLTKLKLITPSLILLDVSMPNMNGLEVLSKLKRDPEKSSIPVVMLTARAETGMIWEAQQMGVKDYITKPFETDDLLKWIRIHERHTENEKGSKI